MEFHKTKESFFLVKKNAQGGANTVLSEFIIAAPFGDELEMSAASFRKMQAGWGLWQEGEDRTWREAEGVRVRAFLHV